MEYYTKKEIGHIQELDNIYAGSAQKVIIFFKELEKGELTGVITETLKENIHISKERRYSVPKTWKVLVKDLNHPKYNEIMEIDCFSVESIKWVQNM